MLTVIGGIIALLLGLALVIAVPICAATVILWALWKVVLVVMIFVIVVKVVKHLL